MIKIMSKRIWFNRKNGFYPWIVEYTKTKQLYVASSKGVLILDPLHRMPKTDIFPSFLLSLLYSFIYEYTTSQKYLRYLSFNKPTNILLCT